MKPGDPRHPGVAAVPPKHLNGVHATKHRPARPAPPFGRFEDRLVGWILAAGGFGLFGYLVAHLAIALFGGHR
jgi:hypothetical protein